MDQSTKIKEDVNQLKDELITEFKNSHKAPWSQQDL